MRKNTILMLLVGILCGGCYPLCQCEYEPGNEVEECAINHEGIQEICVTITLP